MKKIFMQNLSVLKDLFKETLPSNAAEKFLFLLSFAIGILYIVIFLSADRAIFNQILEYDNYPYLKCWFSPEYVLAFRMRHPLFSAIFMPFSIVFSLSAMIFGIKFKFILISLLMTFFFATNNILIFKYLQNIISLRKLYAFLLCLLYMSFGHVMLSVSMPESFSISATVLLISIYTMSKAYKENCAFSVQKLVILFLCSAGVTLSNGIKILADFFILPQIRLISKIKISVLSVFLLFILSITTSLPSYIFMTYYLKKPPLGSSITTNYSGNITEDIFVNMIMEPLLLRNADSMSKISKFADVAPNEHDLKNDNYKSIYKKFGAKYYSDTYETYEVQKYIVIFFYVILFAILSFCVFRQSSVIYMTLIAVPLIFDIFIHAIMRFGLDIAYIYSLHWLWALPLILGWGFAIANGKFVKSILVIFCLCLLVVLIVNNSMSIKELISAYNNF